MLTDRSFICGGSKPQPQSPSNCEPTPTRSARNGRPVAPRGWTPSRNCWLRRDVLGSDHCPLFVELSIAFESPSRPPPLCARFMPEFGGGRTQLKLSAFFADSREKDSARQRDKAAADKLSGQSANSAAIPYFDLTAEDTAPKSSRTSSAASISTSTTMSSRATAQPTSTSSQNSQRQQNASKTPPSVKRKASEKATSTPHTKITMFFDRVSQRPRNATEDADAAPVAARASDRSGSSSSTAISESAAHSEAKSTSPPIVTSDAASANTATNSSASNYPDSDEKSAASTASPSSISASGGSIEGASAAADAEARSAWQRLLSAPAVPLCRHGEPAVKRQVRKEGANRGRHFWCCERSAGRADDPNARCGFFQWCLK